MKGVITVGSGGGSGPTTTAASGAGSNVALVTTPKAAVPRSAGKPAIYWAGWGLFAVGALLALMLIALYVRFTSGFNRQKRLEEEGGSPASHCQSGLRQSREMSELVSSRALATSQASCCDLRLGQCGRWYELDKSRL